MDAFYASVEQRDDPALRGRPVVVAWRGARSVVCAASYEARVFGVRSAMPAMRAERLCPDAVFVPPDFLRYRAVSRQVRQIMLRQTDLVEPLSLDEAYLDVTESVRDGGSATAIAAEIRARIREATDLTASAGVSYNKFLAKLASDHRKPDGLFVVTPRMGPAFVEQLAVGRFHGIGPVTAARMAELGIHIGLDLRRQTREFLIAHFGKAGDYYHGLARAEDDRPVSPDRDRKSLGSETTFARDLLEWDEIAPALAPVFASVWAAYSRDGKPARTVTVKVKYADFRLSTRGRSCAEPVASRETIEAISLDLLRPLFPLRRGVRLLGVTLSNFDVDAHRQLALSLASARPGP